MDDEWFMFCQQTGSRNAVPCVAVGFVFIFRTSSHPSHRHTSSLSTSDWSLRVDGTASGIFYVMSEHESGSRNENRIWLRPRWKSVAFYTWLARLSILGGSRSLMTDHSHPSPNATDDRSMIDMEHKNACR